MRTIYELARFRTTLCVKDLQPELGEVLGFKSPFVNDGDLQNGRDNFIQWTGTADARTWELI